MELPAPLRAAVHAMLEGVPLADLQRAAGLLSTRYRAETRDGRLHLDGELAVKAYLAARLPATYAAIRASLTMIEDAVPEFAPASLLDVGAGPGTALWAASDCWPSLTQARMVEASDPARLAGVALSKHLDTVQCDWTKGDAIRPLEAIPAADLVILSYVLDELPPAAIGPLTAQLWERTRQVLLVIEPGTPAGWQRILAVRQQLVSAGAHILAPCAHQAPCPLVAPDWCHFARRVARSKIHRLTKSGDVPWEDEKYIFIAASRAPAATHVPRVLAPPRPGKAWVDLKLCQPDGTAGQVQIAKRAGARYRVAKRLDWGDAVDVS